MIIIATLIIFIVLIVSIGVLLNALEKSKGANKILQKKIDSDNRALEYSIKWLKDMEPKIKELNKEA